MDLSARMFEHVRLIESFLGLDVEGLRLPIGERAVMLTQALAQRQPGPAGEKLARQICEFMFPNGSPSEQFWATDLGADIAWHIGYPEPEVPIWGVAAVLRVTRVTVWRIRQEHGPIDAAGLRDLARSRGI